MDQIAYSEPALLQNNGYKRISVGLRPSGPVHIGTALTFMQGMKAVYENSGAFLDAYVLDLDFDRQKPKDFVSFMHKKDDYGCHGLMREHVMEDIGHMLGEMGCYLGIDPSRLKVSYFSDLTANPEFRNYMIRLFGSQEGRLLLKEKVIGKAQKASTLISPICRCGHSSVKPPSMVSEKDLLLRAECFNEACDVERYEVDLATPRSLNIHFIIATLRDLVGKEGIAKADIHIFGGDYMLPSGRNREPKIAKVSRFLSGISNEPPLVYVGPLMLSNRKRIRKTRENCFTLDCIAEKRPDWVERLDSLLQDHQEDFVMDMSGMEKYFS